ncbi:MAG: TRAP transporter small permease [Synergistetes bacterium]|nr:TRAP transporter small permease [Synergistota bacterium]MDW8192340.1 TRAP transporter small permease [Synergistota bacterium]
MRRKFEAISKSLFWVSILVIAGLQVVVFYSVIMRYLFRRPPYWSTEVTELMIIMLTFLAIAEVERLDKHIKFSLFVDWLPPRKKCIVNLINILIALAFIALMVWEGGKATWLVYSKGMRVPSLLRTPLSLIYVFLPIGAGALGIQLVIRFLDELEKLREGRA